MMPPEEFALLRWAAGVDVELPALLAVDRDRLLVLLARHKLSERFLDRLTRERPPWGDTRLRVGLWTWCREARAQIHERRLAALREIAGRLPSGSPPLIVVKGIATYGLTGDRRTLSYGGDIDVFAEDPERLRRTMQGLGYACEMLKGHDFAALSRDGVAVELHDHFPVYSYPDGVLAADLTPARHPGHWFQSFPSRTPAQIRYPDLLAHARANVFGEPNIAVPDPDMAALILCAHEFREYLHLPARDSKVKIGNLVEVGDLMRHADFVWDDFQTLVRRFDGQDSVRMVRAALREIGGGDPVPAQAPAEFGHFPQMVGPFGCWAALPNANGLLGEWPLATKTGTLVERLGANRIMAPVGGAGETYSFGAAGGKKTLERVLVQSARAQQIPFQLSVTSDAAAIACEVVFLEPLEEGAEYQVAVYCYGRTPLRHRLNLRAPGTALLGQKGVGAAQCFAHALGCGVRLSLPLPLLRSHYPVPASIPLILSITRWAAHPERDRYGLDLALPLPLDGEKVVFDADPMIVAPLLLSPQGGN